MAEYAEFIEMVVNLAVGRAVQQFQKAVRMEILAGWWGLPKHNDMKAATKGAETRILGTLEVRPRNTCPY